jgi:hypothetical protein
MGPELIASLHLQPPRSPFSQNHFCVEFQLALRTGCEVLKNGRGEFCSQRQEMCRCAQCHPFIWVVEHFSQYRFALISVPSQFGKRRHQPILRHVSLFVVAVFRTTTMLSGFSDVTIFRIHHDSLRHLLSSQGCA